MLTMCNQSSFVQDRSPPGSSRALPIEPRLAIPSRKRDCLVVAAATPLTPDLAPDASLLVSHCRMLLAAGSDGIGFSGRPAKGHDSMAPIASCVLRRCSRPAFRLGAVIVSATALSLRRDRRSRQACARCRCRQYPVDAPLHVQIEYHGRRAHSASMQQWLTGSGRTTCGSVSTISPISAVCRYVPAVMQASREKRFRGSFPESRTVAAISISPNR